MFADGLHWLSKISGRTKRVTPARTPQLTPLKGAMQGRSSQGAAMAAVACDHRGLALDFPATVRSTLAECCGRGGQEFEHIGAGHLAGLTSNTALAVPRGDPCGRGVSFDGILLRRESITGHFTLQVIRQG
jgi:hypothetical protein